MVGAWIRIVIRIAMKVTEAIICAPGAFIPSNSPAKAAVSTGGASGGMRAWWWVPAAGGVVAAGLGTVFFVQAQSAHSQLRGPAGTLTDSQATQLSQSGQTDQMLAMVGFGVGAAALAAAGLMYGLGGPSGASAALAPAPGGLAMSLGGRW